MPETPRPDPLTVPRLDTVFVGSRVLVYEEVDSTNACALRLGGDGTVFIAERQTAGRGRHGRSWHSAPGVGLWFSVAFETRLPGLLFAAPLAVRDALRAWCDPEARWPNDLYLGGKKVCGILLEHRHERTAVGIGINVSHRLADFSPDLRDTATSIELATGAPCDRKELLREVLTRLDDRVIVLKAGVPAADVIEPFRRQWVEACAILGRRIRSHGVEGVVIDVDDNGALRVETVAGEARVVFGQPASIAPVSR